MIDDQTGLDALVEAMACQPVLAIDCEMDSMYAYGTSLCLVQIGWPDGEALIDGLKGLDVTGLGELFGDPERVKIFHGGENDVGLMRDRWGLPFENIFDTMCASQVLGHDGVGLAAVLDRHFDVHVSKKYQKADWRVRPLPDDQAEYARLDVRYLIPLREALLAELEDLNRVDEAGSEFARVSRACIPERPFDPDNWVRVKGSRDLPATRRACLKGLYGARNAIAKIMDRAPYRVLHDSVLLELVRRMPLTTAQYRKVRGINRHMSEADMQSLVDALIAGENEGEIPMPKRAGRRKPWEAGGDGGRLTPGQDNLLKLLRAWRGERAETRGVDIARVATTALLAAIAKAEPKDRGALAAVAGMEDWRMREYADELLALLEKHRA